MDLSGFGYFMFAVIGPLSGAGAGIYGLHRYAVREDAHQRGEEPPESLVGPLVRPLAERLAPRRPVRQAHPEGRPASRRTAPAEPPAEPRAYPSDPPPAPGPPPPVQRPELTLMTPRAEQADPEEALRKFIERKVNSGMRTNQIIREAMKPHRPWNVSRRTVIRRIVEAREAAGQRPASGASGHVAGLGRGRPRA